MRLFNKMKKLSKILTGAAMVLALSAILGSAVLAIPTGEAKDSPVKGVNDIMKILNNIVKVMYQAFFIVAIGFVILAAFTYLTGGDDPEKIKSANKKIIYAAIAIIVALISVGAAQIIGSFVGVN